VPSCSTSLFRIVLCDNRSSPSIRATALLARVIGTVTQENEELGALTMTSYEYLDRQISEFSDALFSIGLDQQEVGKVGTLIASEVRSLDSDAKASVREATPIPIKDRVAELIAFQSWMDQRRTA
jgi:hypothetical protein